jgi:D-beta-D-heptose 7-phosphate kinase / D-beta-D-heptose 1-phosphate adenosyltransferase
MQVMCISSVRLKPWETSWWSASTSDQSTWRIKGPGRLINPEQDRLALITALDMVDHAALFEEDTADALIRLLRPEVSVKGGEYEDVMLPEEETRTIQEVWCQHLVLPLVRSRCMTQLIDQALM